MTLLGDAAHCMYPSLGLGISTAFGDAVALADCLVGKAATKNDVSNKKTVGPSSNAHDFAGVESRLEDYARRRIPVTWALQTGSRLMHGVLAATAERRGEGETCTTMFHSECGFNPEVLLTHYHRLLEKIAST